MVKINSTMKQKEIQAMFDGKEFKGVTFHLQVRRNGTLVLAGRQMHGLGGLYGDGKKVYTWCKRRLGEG